MGIAGLFIKRPIMTTLVMAAILIFGVFAYRLLPVSDLPNVDFPTIQVSASLPGASPDTMAAAVATPLEKQFSTIAGIDSMTSTNSLGSTNITIQFNLSRSIDAAAQDVQSAISKAGRDLPSDMPSPPSFQKVNPADQPILYMALHSPTIRLSDVDEAAETTIAQHISTIDGVAQVSVYGAQKYAVRIQLDPRAMASRQIGIDEVTGAVQKGNVNLPTGTLWARDKAYTIMANGQLTQADQYRPLIVAYRNGSPVRLEQIGNVFDSVENDKTASWYNGERAIILAVQRQPGTNTVEVVDNIKKMLPSLTKDMPAAMTVDIHYDRSVAIRDSVNDVKFTLLLTIALVVMVIFLFLRNISATIIPSLALPMSIVGTFSAMYLLGFSLDNLSLMALTLSVGFVVDDAIVMLENIVRHMEMGKRPMQAAFEGSKEIGFTIISMTISLAAVFIPVLFMGGVVGRLLHEFAITIGVAILVSGFVSLSLTPMLASRFLKHTEVKQHGKFYQASEKVFDGALAFYDWTLRKVLRFKLATFAVSMGVIALTVYMFATMPKGFLPNEDQGVIMATTEGAQGISFDDMMRHQQEADKIIAESGVAERRFSTLNGGNQGRMSLRMPPRTGFFHKSRPSTDELINILRPKLAKIPGLNVFMQTPPPIRLGGYITKTQYAYTLQSGDTKLLYEYAPKLEAEMNKIPQIVDVTSDLQIKNPQVTVDIDRDKAATLGVTAGQIEDALYTAYGSRMVSNIYAPNNEYRVIMELKPEFQLDPAALSMLYIHSANGNLVPLGTVATLKRTVGPLQVNHTQQLPSVTLSFNLRDGASLGEATTAVERVAAKTLPGDIIGGFSGTAQYFQDSTKGLGLLLVAAILVIYIVLGILYESFIHPLTILSGLPSAGVGALLALKLFGIDLNLYSFVGIIMLVGIVKKNAIMMIDFALETERNEGKDPEEAIYQGALVRFRPIMMTTMAALTGTLPIALGVGAGSESRRPLGIAVVGGLILSQMLTLYITPVYYVYLDRLQHAMSRGWARLTGKKKRAERQEALGHHPEPALAASHGRHGDD